MRRIYILINILLFIFTLPKYLTVHSQEGSKEPLAKLWNIDNEDIPKYLSIEKELTLVDTFIRLFLDEDNFGGTYIDVIQNKVVVNTINFARAERLKKDHRIKKYINFLSFIAAKNSTHRLDYRFKEITKLAKSSKPTACMGYIDVQINNIVIGMCDQTRNETKNAEFINAIKEYYPLFAYYYCNGTSVDNFPSPNNMELERRNNIVKKIIAGDGLYITTDKKNGTCTAGFVAIDKANLSYIATAGHCYFGDPKYYLRPWNSEPTTQLIGKINYVITDQIDFGLITIIGDVKPAPNIRNTDSKQQPELLIDDDVTISHYGVHLCISGYYTHVKCGYAKAIGGFSSNGKNFHENIFVVGLTCRKGDSGSPLFSYKQDLMRVSLNGIVSASLRNGIDGNVNGDTVAVITISSILNTMRKFKEIRVATAI